ncbi:hypothetical protein KIJ05_07630 [Leuconostoc gelidum subsp. gasicomitatum]|uniref:hypothetical protein n=1 Tax=Leuconostoc gasicomitatum TaxID=115778 RepID=UPI001CC60DA9|nr:hypothetical protein [Leuconostoc gasicomitatum]MBZ5984986.1 hypothetical protein [Leuconostoc gasicomitatum]
MTKTNVFEIRAFPNGEDHYQDFIDQGVVAIGWPDIGDANSMTQKEIKQRLKEVYPKFENKDSSYLTQVTNFFERFKNLKENDLILIPYLHDFQQTITIVRVTKPYFYNPTPDNLKRHMTHQVSIDLIKIIDREDIAQHCQKLYKSLKARLTLTQLKDPDVYKFLNEVIAIKHNGAYSADQYTRKSKKYLQSEYENSISKLITAINKSNDKLIKKSLIMAALTVNEAYLKMLISREIFKNISKDDELLINILNINIIKKLHSTSLRIDLAKKYFENAIMNDNYYNLRNALAHNLNSVEIDNTDIKYKQTAFSIDYEAPILINDLFDCLKNYANNIKYKSDTQDDTPTVKSI